MNDNDAGSEAAAGGAAKRLQFQFTLPPPQKLLITLGALLMVIAPLLSWFKAEGLDAFPNLAGAGWSSGGAGVMVLLIGALLLVRRPSAGLAIGRSLGAMLVSLIFILRAADGTVAAGAWVGLIGSILVILGIGVSLTDADNRPALQVSRAGAALLGAVLAGIGSFWLDWEISFSSESLEGGLNTEVIAGFPVLILAVAALLSLLTLLDAGASDRAKSMAAFHIQYAGACIAVVAAADILGSLMGGVGGMMTGGGLVSSGPVVALVGAFFITRSVQPAEAA